MLRVQVLTRIVEAGQEPDARDAAEELSAVLSQLEERFDDDYARATAALAAQSGAAARGA
jgi:hypothetical protein